MSPRAHLSVCLYFLSLLFFLEISFSIAVGCLFHYSVECGVERLSVGKSDCDAYLFYGFVGVSLIDHAVQSLFYAVFVEQAREIHVESRVYYCRNVARICL